MNSIAFGVEIASNIDLGPLPEAVPVFPAVVFRHRQVQHLGGSVLADASFQTQGRVLSFAHSGARARSRVQDLLQFSIHLQRGLILCTSTADATPELVRYWFLQKALPLYLLLSGYVEMLHASAIAVGDRVVGFLAPSGTGKSTMVHHFLSMGHALIADEHLMVLPGTTTVVPTIPYLRQRRIAESLGDCAAAYCAAPRPLQALYLLQRAGKQEPVRIEQLSGAAAGVSLCMQKQFETRLFYKSDTLAHVPPLRLKRLLALAETVPVKRIHVPRDMARLHECYAAIQKDLE
ncbi:hypothetical protein [Acidipila sp. EB88]|uniref:hypothetical protein n=1 Tax=Acidipila sp. EB88 TaxID=2305226 RepID=UPI000F5EED81|nr:hypothetical protein [Acidipila sp. EB88]RRA47447.1 hypothetical protein D1Y84_03180 [Acidipila sp. EB88]